MSQFGSQLYFHLYVLVLIFIFEDTDYSLSDNAFSPSFCLAGVYLSV